MHSQTGSYRFSDTFFRFLTASSAILSFLVIIGIGISLVIDSRLALHKFGFSFLTTSVWNPVTGEFGALSSIFGTVVSTLIAMLIAVPMSLMIALFLVEFSHPFLSRIVGYAIELLASIPSIIFGMWGLFVFVPYMADHIQPLLGDHLGFLPLFAGPPMGVGMLTAGIILALMILPFMSAVMRDVLRMVPPVLKESGYGMGSTTWEVTKKIVVPYGLKGLVGASFLGLGRAIGETMAVTFVIGNDHSISSSLFSPGNSIASTLANEFTEAAEPLYLHSLVELGLILFVITFLIQVAAQMWLGYLNRAMGRR